MAQERSCNCVLKGDGLCDHSQSLIATDFYVEFTDPVAGGNVWISLGETWSKAYRTWCDKYKQRSALYQTTTRLLLPQVEEEDDGVQGAEVPV